MELVIYFLGDVWLATFSSFQFGGIQRDYFAVEMATSVPQFHAPPQGLDN